MPVVMSRASHVDTVVASAAAIVAKAKPSTKRRNTAATSAKAIPSPRAKTLRLSSIAASSSSSRTIALARSATSLTAAPRPCVPRPSVSWVCMPSPVDPLRQNDARNERCAHHDPRVRPAAVSLRLRPRTELRAGRREPWPAGFVVRRSPTPGARLDEARLHPPDELGVLGKRLGELGLQPALTGHLICQLLQLVGHSIDCLVGAHFVVGGSSPVSVRHTRAAARRETTVARAPKAP